MKGICSKEDVEKVKDFFNNTTLGSYIKNWVIGILGITLIVTVIYVLACFIAWSIIIPTSPFSEKGSTSLGVFTRLGLTIYSTVVLIITTSEDDDY